MSSLKATRSWWPILSKPPRPMARSVGIGSRRAVSNVVGGSPPPLLGSGAGEKAEQVQVVGRHGYPRCIYHDVSGQTLIEQWTVHQADHAWSGGSPSGSYTDPQ